MKEKYWRKQSIFHNKFNRKGLKGGGGKTINALLKRIQNNQLKKG
jgi:hypothetical protein